MVKKIIIAASVLGALGFTGIANADTPATTTVSAFTQCMRQHGLPDFPEIDVTDGGQVHLELTGTHVNPLSQVYGAAVKACESQLPSGALLPTAPKAPSAVPAVPGVPADGNCSWCPEPPTAPKAPIG